MYRPARLRFGVFMAPLHHRWGENPTLAFQEDLAFIEYLDYLGFDEAWIGEHHSGAIEIFASPEVMIAAAAQRTKRIMLGSGVIDLPLHHPFMVADRMVMLDNLTMGRAMLGVGSGALKADFTMIGQNPDLKTQRSAEGLEAIVRLLRAEEPLTMKTAWFELKDARLQLSSFTKPHLHIAVAGSSSEDQSSAAGRYGLGQLSAGRSPESLKDQWAWVEESAQQHGQTVSREDWRVTKFVHVAQTRQAALDDCRERFPTFSGLQLAGGRPEDGDRMPEMAVERGGAVIGTPADAIEHIQCLLDGSGGFGCFLFAMYGLADRAATMRSFELFTRHVIPHFNGQYATMSANHDWVVATGGGPYMGRRVV